MPTFGYTMVGTYGREGINSVIAGYRATPTSSGTVSKITPHLSAIYNSGTIKVKCAIYRDSDKSLVPNSETNERIWTNELAPNWYDFDYVGRTAPNIVAGTTYLIVVWASHSNAALPASAVTVSMDNLTGSSAVQTITYGAFPATLTSTNNTRKYSVYATYVEGTGTPWQIAISVNDPAMGTTNPAPNTWDVPSGQPLTVTAQPIAGNYLEHWNFDGTDYTGASIDIPAQASGTAHTLIAYFAATPEVVPGWFGNNILPDVIDVTHSWQYEIDNKLSCHFVTTKSLTIGIIVAHIAKGWANAQPYVRAGIYDVNNNLICTTEAKLLTSIDYSWVVLRIQDASGNPLDVDLPAGEYWLSLQVGGYGGINIAALFQYTSQAEVVSDTYADGMDAVLSHASPFTLWRDPCIFASAPVPFPPTANFAFANTTLGSITTFDASSTGQGYDGYNLTTLKNFAWDFGDGATSPINSSPTTSHLYGAEADYQVTLTVTDSIGQTDTITKTVSITGAPPQPPLPSELLPPAIPNVVLKYSTDFRNAKITSNACLSGIGELSGGPGNYGNWIINFGNAQTQYLLATYPDGQKAFGAFRFSGAVDRAAIAIFPRYVDSSGVAHLVVGKEFLFEKYMYFPAGYHIGSTSPGESWLAWNDCADNYNFNPKWETHLLGHYGRPNGWCSKGGYYNQAVCEAAGGIWYPGCPLGEEILSISNRNYPNGVQQTLLGNPIYNYKLPTGRWFKVSWLQKLGDATTKGYLKVYIDNILVLETDNSAIESGWFNPDNPDWHFAVSLIKLYGDSDGTMPQEAWVSNVALYDVTPAAPVSLTVAVSGNGTTNPIPGTYQITQGNTVQVSAIPSTGYMFDHWELDGINAGSTSPYSVLMNTDHSILAVFTELPPPPPEKQYLSIVAINGQTDPAPATYTLDKDSSITVTATANQGYIFKHWLFDDVIAGTDPTITVVMDTNHTLVAVCEAVSPTPKFPVLEAGLGLLGIAGLIFLATRKKG